MQRWGDSCDVNQATIEVMRLLRSLNLTVRKVLLWWLQLSRNREIADSRTQTLHCRYLPDESDVVRDRTCVSGRSKGTSCAIPVIYNAASAPIVVYQPLITNTTWGQFPPFKNPFTVQFIARRRPLAGMDDQTRIDLANAKEINEVVTDVMIQHASSRLANTIKQYVPKQAEWCAGKKYADGCIVSEGKLVTFLKKYVIPGGNKRQKMEDGDNKPRRIAGVEAYAKAVIDLYKLQQTLKTNGHTHPCGKV
jgi:hypothetical protein